MKVQMMENKDKWHCMHKRMRVRKRNLFDPFQQLLSRKDMQRFEASDTIDFIIKQDRERVICMFDLLR